ncbi:hypothetical protein KBZ10_25375 [Streptomyces sp. F63]|uniref:SpvB/TcaC N-terminal domain-containing protein n=1 Tax=Streptomyces sp. F63 TaxID=2824887 RepID=UPI001B39BFAB|nr:SpvB/TcaC N-terminal domain-containing protein [Streptomyces sp. F63]MBQ0987788.1 hypothetical protein [Streptomyces sp. F63]
MNADASTNDGVPAGVVPQSSGLSGGAPDGGIESALGADTALGAAWSPLGPLDVTRTRMPGDGGTQQGLTPHVTTAALTGAAMVGIGVETSRARGFEPDVTIGYSSQSGDGIFGLGFTLDLPSVARRTNTSVPRYDGSDTFQLDDAPLVLLPGSVTRRAFDGVAYTVSAYARRSAEVRERVERWSSDAAGADFWRTIDRSGVITVFGLTPLARVADPDDPRRVFAWLPQARYDGSGSAILFTYQGEDATGVPDVLHERNRQRSANRYPQSIRYGNRLPFHPDSPLILPDGPWHIELAFDYGEYDFSPAHDTPYRPVRPWSARELPFSDYSAGFERRTHRLCRAIGLFHRFDELGPEPVLVRSTSFTYDTEASGGLATHLVEARGTGHRYIAARPPGKRYWTADEPPLALRYHPPTIEGARFVPLSTRSEGVPPMADQPPSYCLADLDGDGVDGIVYADQAAITYWRPTLDRAAPDGPVRFEPQTPVTFPIEREAWGTCRLGDVTGDGRLSLIVESETRAGYYARGSDGTWRPFTAFAGHVTDAAAGAPHDRGRASVPKRLSPSTGGHTYCRADVTGNGLPDLIHINDTSVTYSANMGPAGYAAFRRRTRRADLPSAVLEAPRTATRFANVLGGGQQLVLVESGRVICWPSLGHGTFGAPVEMSEVPSFDDVSSENVHLVDLTGTGTDDLVLLRPGHVCVHLNRGGNGFLPEPLVVPTPETTHGILTIGNVTTDGRRSLVWNTGGPHPRLHALTLVAGADPFRLSEYNANRGTRVRLGYTTSTRMRLRDEARGEPWLLTLPFPVVVVETMEVDDEIAAVRSTNTYRYRDGYFDSEERMFTGFARVDRTETETVLPDEPPRDGPEDTSVTGAEPLLTRSWFHVGAYAVDGLEEALRREYFRGDVDVCPIGGPVFDWRGAVPSGSLRRQAHHALAGILRRVEIYDASRPDVPYRVAECGMSVRPVARATAGAGAFLVHERESIDYRYERDASDPAVQHRFTLAVDEYGVVSRSCTVLYRRRPGRAALAGQDETIVTAHVGDFLPPRDEADVLLFGFPRLSRTYAVNGIAAPAVRGLYYDVDSISRQVELALANQRSADPAPDASAMPETGLLAGERLTYAGPHGGQDPSGELAVPPRVCRRDVAAFTDAQVCDLLAGVALPVPPERFMSEWGGYVNDAEAGVWWCPGDTTLYDPERFWVPSRVLDPMAALEPARGVTRTLVYDETAMALREAVQRAEGGGVLDQRITAESIDYQSLLPQRVRDATGVVSEVLYDPRGRVFATAFRGTEWMDGVPREKGFEPLPVTDPVSWPQPRDVLELAADPAAFLGPAAAFFFHDDLGWCRDRAPALSAAATARAYPQDAPGQDTADPPTLTIRYADGAGRLLQTTTAVPPEPSPSAAPTLGEGPPGWAVNSRIRYTGRGGAWRHYLPFLTDSLTFPGTAELERTTNAATTSYDALDRHTRTDFPLGDFPHAFFTTTRYGPWAVTEADVNDTVTESAYYRHHIIDGHVLPQREREALIAAARCAGTPTTRHLDVRGGTIAEERRLTPQRSLISLFRHDALGRQISAADPRQAAAGRTNLTVRYGLTPDPVKTTSVDAGTRMRLIDATGAPLIEADGRGNTLIHERDPLRRSVALILQSGPRAGISLDTGAGSANAPDRPAAGSSVIIERRVYGDTLDGTGETVFPDPGRRGLIGRLCVRYDQAGRHQVDSYALTGQGLSSSESFTADIEHDPDWRTGDWTTWAELFAALADRLEPSEYHATSRYDPQGRVLAGTDPHGHTTAWHYDRAGRVCGIDVAVQGGTAAPYATDISYNAAGRCRGLALRSTQGDRIIERELRYHKDTQRLVAIRATRTGDDTVVQDLNYVYDPAGNVISVDDAAAPGGESGVSADLTYTYDALYRLTEATGRATASFDAEAAASGGYTKVYAPWRQGRLVRYSAAYGYDDSGNCLRQTFITAEGSWTTALTAADDSNRVTVGDAFDLSEFDEDGNALKLPTVPELTWDHRSALRTTRSETPSGTPLGAEHYAYDSEGARRRRVTRAPDGSTTDTRYFPGLVTERRSGPHGQLHAEQGRIEVHDGSQRLGEVLVHRGEPGSNPVVQRRHQLPNLVDSATAEFDDDASWISYEEYAPFGVTVFVTGRSQDEVAKKMYRYTGQQRDGTTGLAYHGARYYAPWLLRWITPDPAGTLDGLNLYTYCANNPTVHVDPTGHNGGRPRLKFSENRRFAIKPGEPQVYVREDVRPNQVAKALQAGTEALRNEGHTYRSYSLGKDVLCDCLHTAEEIINNQVGKLKWGAGSYSRIEVRSAGREERFESFGESDQQNRSQAENFARPRNGSASPGVGEAFVIVATDTGDTKMCQFHAGAVVALDGPTRITLEAWSDNKNPPGKAPAHAHLYTVGSSTSSFHAVWGEGEGYFVGAKPITVVVQPASSKS